MSVAASLKEFQETEGGESFRLQHSKMLKVELGDETIQAKLGSMVAYQGEVKFEHAGSGGLARMAKKAVTGEGAELMKISGTGEVFLADLAQDIQLLKLEDEAITVNGANLLAFDAEIDWDIKRVEGVSGMLGGGLYNTHLEGSGHVAVISDGTPVLLEIDGEDTFADPQAAITWSQGLETSVKTDVSVKNLIGRGSGESFQMAFTGKGWLLIQPSEGRVAAPSQAGGSGAGAGGTLGKILGG
ncbi:MAG: AIM24 family protein [Solirubrobacterales bacterium]